MYIQTGLKPNVAFLHPDAELLFPEYVLIGDVIEGEVAIKKAGTKYLPVPGEDLDEDPVVTETRYKNYKKRAVFYNVARQTLNGLIGQVFLRDPIIKVSSQLNKLVENANGEGTSLIQQSKKALTSCLAYSRCGIFVDFPKTENPVSIKDINEGNFRPTLHVYEPLEIYNWRTQEIGAEDVLTLIVLFEKFPLYDDGFEVKYAIQFRVLRLVNGLYVHEVWREEEPTFYKESLRYTGNFIKKETYHPTDNSGKRLDRIPFFFCGSQNNDPKPDSPNFYDICSLNLAHYRNSADYEESCFLVGQPTPVVSGVNEHWAKEVLGGKIRLGSRGLIPLPEGGEASLLQAKENSMIFEAMKHKEKQMIALGAKLVENKEVQRTATETTLEVASENSILASVTKNVSSVLTKALNFASNWLGVSEEQIIELNTEFEINKMSPEMRREAIEEWNAGAITFTEMRHILRKGGIATESDEAAKKELEAKKQEEADKEQAKLEQKQQNTQNREN